VTDFTKVTDAEGLVAWVAEFNPWLQDDLLQVIRCHFCHKTFSFDSGIPSLMNSLRAAMDAGTDHESYCCWQKCVQFRDAKRPK
jgi:hypothetical protein